MQTQVCYVRFIADFPLILGVKVITYVYIQVSRMHVRYVWISVSWIIYIPVNYIWYHLISLHVEAKITEI